MTTAKHDGTVLGMEGYIATLEERVRQLEVLHAGPRLLSHAELTEARQDPLVDAIAKDRIEDVATGRTSRHTRSRPPDGGFVVQPKFNVETCPRCGGILERDEVDVGPGVITGPAGCPACFWVEGDADEVLAVMNAAEVAAWGGPEAHAEALKRMMAEQHSVTNAALGMSRMRAAVVIGPPMPPAIAEMFSTTVPGEESPADASPISIHDHLEALANTDGHELIIYEDEPHAVVLASSPRAVEALVAWFNSVRSNFNTETKEQ